MNNGSSENEKMPSNIWGNKVVYLSFWILVLVFALYFTANYLGCMSPNEEAINIIGD